ncbi:HWE histidine kinase domain-containing protein [Paracoccus benzoatiresistens]|uniref:histidine kinase n=1 Tax=Paracoccus benzoatiresistens TaxID=2997341 RepID=A0ABT4J4A5_9RHOB|nr:HWE histidine kinase domain-containing protein [Paracoccus sp. EF6]MCZ0961965.1 PAS domain-containing protein [Paracoccus sp. EF6]
MDMTDPGKEPILQGGGECGALLRGLDWARNPLGPPSAWPAELAALVGIALASAQPMLIVWGPQQITLYNDGYAAMCGQRHPAALGRPFKELWFDIWDQVGPIITAAYEGKSTSMDDIEFTMHRNGYPERTNFAFSYTPVRDRSGAVLGMFCPCTETTPVVALRDAQRVERSGFLQIFEVALGAVALLSGPDHIFRFANTDYLRLVGNRDVIGKPVRAAMPEVVAQGFIDILDRVYRTGESHVGRHVPVILQTHPRAVARQHFVDFLYHPIRGDSEAINGIFVQAIDVTERVDEDQRRQMLLGELSHRMKNQLAMIQAIVNQTLRSADDLASAAKVLSERIRVLSGAHDILMEGRTNSTTVDEIVHRTLSLHDHGSETRFRIEGPALAIASRPALSLALILHELSTNAAKYGALSNDAGVVRIAWKTLRSPQKGERFVLTWAEEGGPLISQPETFGSGSRLIGAGLSGTIDCEVATDYAPQGLRCEINADLESVQSSD